MSGQKIVAKIYDGGGDCFDRRINNWTDAAEFCNILTSFVNWLLVEMKQNEHNEASKTLSKLVEFSFDRINYGWTKMIWICLQ